MRDKCKLTALSPLNQNLPIQAFKNENKEKYLTNHGSKYCIVKFGSFSDISVLGLPCISRSKKMGFL